LEMASLCTGSFLLRFLLRTLHAAVQQRELHRGSLFELQRGSIRWEMLRPKMHGRKCELQNCRFDMTETFQTIFKIERRKNPFLMMDKQILEIPEMSWKAKGLLAYLLSRPDDWKIYLRDLINRSSDGKSAVQTALKELRKFGFSKIETMRDAKTGQVKGRIIRISEEGQFTERPVFRLTGKPSYGKSARTINKGNKEEIILRAGAEGPSLKIGKSSKKDKYGQACQEFDNFVIKKRWRAKHFKKPNLGKWRFHLKEFVTETLQSDWDRFRETLDWYYENHDDPWTPKIFSLSKFCDRYHQIEDSMLRKQKRGPIREKEEEMIKIVRTDKEFNSYKGRSCEIKEVSDL
jgi:hypothetical protein